MNLVASQAKTAMNGIDLPENLALFAGMGGGIESWLSSSTPEDVLDRIKALQGIEWVIPGYHSGGKGCG